MNFRVPKWSHSALIFSLLFLPTVVSAAPRDVQIVAFDFETQVIELFNFGPSMSRCYGKIESGQFICTLILRSSCAENLFLQSLTALFRCFRNSMNIGN